MTIRSAQLEQSSPIRALHSLRDTHAETAEAAVASFGPRWSLERHESYDGHLILQLAPGEEGECVFVLHGVAQGVHLALFSADSDYASLGRFETLQAALGFVQRLAAGEIPLPAVAPAA